MFFAMRDGGFRGGNRHDSRQADERRAKGDNMTNEQLEQRCRQLENELEAIREEIQALRTRPLSQESSQNGRFRAIRRSAPWLLGIVLASGLVFAQTKEALFIDERGSVGIGTAAPRATLDIQQASRTGVHPQNIPGLYVTGDFGDAAGIEFRHTNGTQGIGFGYNTIYATGGNANQNLNLKPRGAGQVSVEGKALKTNGLQIGATTVGERELQLLSGLAAGKMQIGKATIGEHELQILSRLAAGHLEVDLFNVKQGEYLYAADYAPYDKDRRRVFTWRPKSRPDQSRWILRSPQ
jgi:hypothetical protein